MTTMRKGAVRAGKVSGVRRPKRSYISHEDMERQIQSVRTKSIKALKRRGIKAKP